MESNVIADLGSLQNLHDLVLPAPVGFWPPAPGWHIVFAVIGLATLWAVVRQLMAWRRNAYRREALARLEAISGPDGRLEQVAALMKRVALSAYARERVAGLSGREWLVFLDQTGGTTEFTSGPGRMLETAEYRRHDQIETVPEDLIAIAADWIRNHYPDPEP